MISNEYENNLQEFASYLKIYVNEIKKTLESEEFSNSLSDRDIL